MQIRIRVRPKQGYHYPSKIDQLLIDSSARLETIQANYSTQTQGSTTRLYFGPYELPLNSSVGSHNFDDGAIIECCRSPAISAALSACLKDLDAVRKLRTVDRNRQRLMDILQTPLHIRNDSAHDIWQASSWTDESIKSRTINFATIKAVIQRQDRYQVHDLPQCNDAESLYHALQAQNVWSGGTSSSRRNNSRWNQQGHIFKPQKKNGSGPTTNWILLEAKLTIIEQIKRDFRDDSTSSEDHLEEFVKRDHARHELMGQHTPNRRNTTSHSANCTHDDSEAYLMHLASSPLPSAAMPQQSTRRRNAASTPHLTITDASTLTTRSPTNKYIPQYASAPFAVLATLYLAMHAKLNQLKGRRLLTLTEDELKRLAQPMCRSNLYDKMRIRGRNAFVCMDGLIEKKLVRKEIVRNPETGLEIEKWGLLADGETMGGFCAEFERAVRKVIPKSDVKAGASGKSMNLVLCMDSREDVHYLERLKRSCEDENILFLEKELPAGDYLFLEESLDEIVPLVIERKSWSDLADSCLGKGRANNRLDCVRLTPSTAGNSCGGNCQLCKMKRCGCSQILFIIEGERCQAQRHTTCTVGNCCSACKLLSERHNVTQTDLEGVITRLQIEYGCFIHYTKGFNDTICSLFTIRTLLQRSGSYASQVFQKMNGRRSLLFEVFKSNALRRSQIGSDGDRYLQAKSLHEWDLQAFIPLIANSLWDLSTVHLLLGSEKLTAPKKKVGGSCSEPSNKIISLYSDSDDSSVKVIDKLDHQKQPEPICLDFDSDDESILDVTTSKHNIQRKSGDSGIIRDGDRRVPVKKRKASQISSSGSFLRSHEEHTRSILVLHRLGHYETQSGKKLEMIWRSMCDDDYRELDGFYDKAVRHLKDSIGASSFPFVHSTTIAAFSLWMQLIMGVQVRFVQGSDTVLEIQRKSDECCRSLAISTEDSSTVHLPQNSSSSVTELSAQPSSSTLYSTTTKSNPTVCHIKQAKHTYSIRPSSSTVDDAIRQARLQRFDKTYHPMESISKPFSMSNQSSGSVGWSCQQCTLHNDSSSAECDACGFPCGSLYNNKPQTLPSCEFWICHFCASVNSLSDNKCKDCGYQHEVNFEVRPNSSANKKVRCGACGKEGHNRSTATEYNCDAYNDEKEIERREKLRQKKEAAIEQERLKIERLEREGKTAEQLHQEWLQKTEEMKQSNAQAEEYRNDVLKRAKAKMKRLQKLNR